MALRRPDWLGSALLLWLGTGVLALFLLCNPQGSALWTRLGATRCAALLLGLVALGAALPGWHPATWLLALSTAAWALLPLAMARWAGPAGLAGAVTLVLVRALRTRTSSTHGGESATPGASSPHPGKGGDRIDP